MYVVVRIWDLRRLVLPLSYFLDHPFQNWTRTSAQILGNTLLYADYTVPMTELRAELRRICESTKLWRGQVCVLQASDCRRAHRPVARSHGCAQLRRRLGSPLPGARRSD